MRKEGWSREISLFPRLFCLGYLITLEHPVFQTPDTKNAGSHRKELVKGFSLTGVP